MCRLCGWEALFPPKEAGSHLPPQEAQRASAGVKPSLNLSRLWRLSVLPIGPCVARIPRKWEEITLPGDSIANYSSLCSQHSL